MCGDAELRTPVHVPCADLDLDRLAARPDHRGVQALVHVELGHGDVVFEAPRHRAPPRVHGTEHGVAVLDRIDDDAHAHEVVDVRKIMAAHDHLLVDREIVLRSAGHIGLDVQVLQIVVDLGHDLLEIDLALPRAMCHEHHDLVVDLRVKHFEAQFLELRLDGVHAEAVGERRVDIERLARLLLRARRLNVTPSARVVHAVGEFDDEHAHIAAHRHDHLADRLRLRGIAVIHLRQLRDAIHKPGHGVAELRTALVERIVGVFHRVVQQAGRHNQGPHAQVGQDLRHGNRVDDVRLARFAPLGGMLAHRTRIGAREDLHVFVRMVLTADRQDRQQRVQRVLADLAPQHVRRLHLMLRVRHTLLLSLWSLMRAQRNAVRGRHHCTRAYAMCCRYMSRPHATHTPVEPNPRSARSEPGSASAGTNRASTYRWITSCAMRSPGSNTTVCSASRLINGTIISPR